MFECRYRILGDSLKEGRKAEMEEERLKKVVEISRPIVKGFVNNFQEQLCISIRDKVPFL